MRSEYLQYLPRIFKEGAGDEFEFLGQYLKIFEALLSGREDADVRGLEDQISQFVNCLDPGLTPTEEILYSNGKQVLDSRFLTYLAQWVALTLDLNWPLEKKRQWLQKIVPLYKKRGTKSGMHQYLNMFVGRQVLIEEPEGNFIVGDKDHSIVGVNTFIDEPAYFFWVKFNYGFPPEDFKISIWKNLWKGIKFIINLEKPVHTYYQIDARTPGIIVGKRSTVDKDTLIWEKSYYKLDAYSIGFVVGERSTIGKDTIISKDTLAWKDIYIWENSREI